MAKSKNKMRRTDDIEKLYRLLVEKVKDYAIFTTDPSGHVILWNTGAERVLGYREAEILGRPASIIFTPAPVPAACPRRKPAAPSPRS